jgi:uncharacterized protein (DUF1330 family)
VSVDASPGALEELAQTVAADESLVLINLLRFRETVVLDGAERSGREAYASYGRALEPLIARVGGRPLWLGTAAMSLIGPSDEPWDEIILVSYPSRTAFERLVRSSEFARHAHLRTAALEDSRLIVATNGRSIGRGAWRVYRLVSVIRGRG